MILLSSPCTLGVLGVGAVTNISHRCDRQTQTDYQTDRQTDRQTDTYTDRHRLSDTGSHIQTVRNEKLILHFAAVSCKVHKSDKQQ